MTWEMTSVTDGTECLIVLDGFSLKVSAEAIEEQQARAFERALSRFREARLRPYGYANGLAATLYAQWQQLQSTTP